MLLTALNLLLRTVSAAFGMGCVTWDLSGWRDCQRLPAAQLTDWHEAIGAARALRLA